MKTLKQLPLLFVFGMFAFAGQGQAWAGDLFKKDTHPELFCMAQNIYFEARSDNLIGQYAVADVVLNRVYDTRYPNTICKVVYEGPTSESWKTRGKDVPDEERKFNPIRHRCQFSWFCDGKTDDIKNGDDWRRAQEIAYLLVIRQQYRGVTEGATHYHATYVSPSWADKFQLIGRIGLHIFYRADKRK